MRSHFDSEIHRLDTLMFEMGALCESAIACAMKALLENSGEDAARAMQLELEVNRKERDIEELCYDLLLRQQPVAKDLRQVSSALKMVTDMERIGDQAADIAEIARLGTASNEECRFVVEDMAIAAIGMVTGCIDAYVKRDEKLAQQVIANDDIVDDYFNKAKHQLAALLFANSQKAECIIDVLMIAKYLERIGDHAVNIAEWVFFAVTGNHVQKDPH